MATEESLAQLEVRVLGAEGHLKTVINATMTTYEKGEWVTLVRAQMRRQKKKEEEEEAERQRANAAVGLMSRLFG